jgi:hypothetical protein
MVNAADIIARGYVFEKEYEAMSASKKLCKINLRHADGEVEGIWIYPLEKDTVAGTKFHFVFFNDPLAFLGGPRPTAGMVGIGTSTGSETRGTAEAMECIELFKKAGEPAIKEFRDSAARYEAEKKAKKEAN